MYSVLSNFAPIYSYEHFNSDLELTNRQQNTQLDICRVRDTSKSNRKITKVTVNSHQYDITLCHNIDCILNDDCSTRLANKVDCKPVPLFGYGFYCKAIKKINIDMKLNLHEL